MKEAGEVLRAGVRRGLLLSPARASLAAFSAALVVLSFAVYAALLPGLAERLAPQATYNERSFSPETTAADVVRSLVGGGSNAGHNEEGAAPGDGESAALPLSSSGVLGSAMLSASETVQRAAAEEASKGSGAQASGGSDSSVAAGESGASAAQPSGGTASSGSGSSESGSSNSSSASLTPSQESAFRGTLVECFNTLVEVSGSVRESYGRLSTCANTGDFSDAASWYSATSSYDSTIDSVKATLNRQVAVAEQSQYYQAWTEIQLMTNDLGRASAETLGCWEQAAATGSASAATSAPGYYNSYRTHESNARNLL